MKKIFSERIRELRGVQNQAKIAEKLGISPAKLSRLEQGRFEPDLETIAQCARFFGVTADWLLGLSDARAPRPAPLPTDAVSGDAEALREEVARLARVRQAGTRLRAR